MDDNVDIYFTITMAFRFLQERGCRHWLISKPLDHDKKLVNYKQSGKLVLLTLPEIS